MQLVNTLLADSHQIFLEGLKIVLKNDTSYEHHIVGCSTSGARIVDLWQEHRPDLLIMSLNLMDRNGLEVIRQIRQENKDNHLCILVMTVHQEPKILRAVLDNGANGYLPKYKSGLDLYKAIQAVLGGEIYKIEPLKNGLDKLFKDKVSRTSLISEGFIQEHRLTKRETQILSLISQALSNKEIGRKLFISDQTVSVHRKNIMRKLGVRSTAGLIKMTYDHSL